MITVLRLGHRPERDKRITTHVCLTARALNADKVIVSERDDRVVAGVRGVVDRFGGPFEVESGVPHRRVLRDFPGEKVHLTMYGLPLEEVVPRLRWPEKDLLVVVGAEKVPREVYEMVDHNVAVGNQPHSEVAALALFLYAVQGPAAMRKRFVGGQVEVVPSARGKDVRGGAPDDAAETGEGDGSFDGE